MTHIVGFAGSFSDPSRTRSLVQTAVDEAVHRGGFGGLVFDLGDFGPSLGQARQLDDLDPGARRLVNAIIDADALVIGSPVYKGSYGGLFKHLFDLIDPEALRGKPVLLAATGGGHRHALVIEHQLKPLFGFFEAAVIPTGIYAATSEIENGRIVVPAVATRLSTAVGQLIDAIDAARPVARLVTNAA